MSKTGLTFPLFDQSLDIYLFIYLKPHPSSLGLASRSIPQKKKKKPTQDLRDSLANRNERFVYEGRG